MQALRVAHHATGRLWTTSLGAGAMEPLGVTTAVAGQLMPAACQLPVRLYAAANGSGEGDEPGGAGGFGARLWAR